MFAANGEDEDFSLLQNPQTPSSSISTAAKTPQCLHISPGMLGSINKYAFISCALHSSGLLPHFRNFSKTIFLFILRKDMDKYIFHLQKNQKERKRGKKAAPMVGLKILLIFNLINDRTVLFIDRNMFN